MYLMIIKLSSSIEKKCNEYGWNNYVGLTWKQKLTLPASQRAFQSIHAYIPLKGEYIRMITLLRRWKNCPKEVACCARIKPSFYMELQEALDSFACPNESKIYYPPAPLAAYPGQSITSFFLNLSRTLHQRAELGVVNIGHQWPATTIKQHRWNNWCEYY